MATIISVLKSENRFALSKAKREAMNVKNMTFEERKAQVNFYLGKSVTITIDRPLGYIHKKGSYSLTYPINYGFIPGVIGGDGEELDVYLLGVNEPVRTYDCKIIAVVHRHNDIEDKLIGAPVGAVFTKKEIEAAVHFQEQYYNTEIQTLQPDQTLDNICNKCYSDKKSNEVNS